MNAGPPTLVTARLRLRPFVPGDAADVQRLAGERAELGGWIAAPHWGRGFATEAASAAAGPRVGTGPALETGRRVRRGSGEGPA